MTDRTHGISHVARVQRLDVETVLIEELDGNLQFYTTEPITDEFERVCAETVNFYEWAIGLTDEDRLMLMAVVDPDQPMPSEVELQAKLDALKAHPAQGAIDQIRAALDRINEEEE